MYEDDAFLDAYIAELEDGERTEDDMNPEDFSRCESFLN